MASSRISRSAPEPGTRLSGPPAAVYRVIGGIDLRGKSVAVALSGGVDSVVLLHILLKLAARHGFELRAIHVDHGISPNAGSWARFCRRLCRRWRVPLEVRRVNIGARRGIGLEAAARRARRRALATVNADVLVLAHQLDDQAETVLMSLLRGAGLRGASGMPVLGRFGRKPLLRPMLAVARTEVLRYATAEGLEWIEDESNDDLSLTRGYLRRRVLPPLQERYPRWREALARAARHFSEAEMVLRSLTRAGGSLRAEDLRERTPTLAKTLLRDYLEMHGLRAPTERRLAEMLRQLTGSGARTAIAHDGALLRLYRGAIRVEQPAARGGFAAVRWSGQRKLDLPALGGELRLRPTRGAGIDVARLKAGTVCVRLRSGGERLQPDPGRPRRTLKNLFQEAGVPPWRRDRLPLLYCDGDLVWVPGLGIDARYQAAARARGLLPEWHPHGTAALAQAFVFTRFDSAP
jgi:tRNA(Ile)-lysidine synthase